LTDPNKHNGSMSMNKGVNHLFMMKIHSLYCKLQSFISVQSSIYNLV